MPRSYRATYMRYPIAIYNSLIFRDFIGPDDFLGAVHIAEDAREDGEKLLNVVEQIGQTR